MKVKVKNKGLVVSWDELKAGDVFVFVQDTMKDYEFPCMKISDDELFLGGGYVGKEKRMLPEYLDLLTGQVWRRLKHMQDWECEVLNATVVIG